MPWDITFSGSRFAHTYVGNKARRRLKQFLDGIGGPKNLIFVIQRDKNLLDYVPQESIAQFYHSYTQFKAHSDKFSDDELYSWIPDDYRALIESIPRGKEWAMRQVQDLRKLLL